MGHFTKLTAADGFSFSAYESAPIGPAKGAVVVLQEIFGVNAHVQRITRSVLDRMLKDSPSRAR